MKHGERKKQVIELVRQRGSVAIRDVIDHCQITRNNASVVLLALTKRGSLVREGESQKYRYRLPDAA